MKTIYDALKFELDHNFICTKEERALVLSKASLEIDTKAPCYGSGIDFYEFVDETLFEVLSKI